MNVDILKDLTMPRICATNVTTSMEGTRSHGDATMKSCMLMDCARTATSMLIIK